MGTTQYVTAEGFEKLNAELHHLKTTKRKELAGRIQDAKELGDLSENAEYHEAKNEQSFVEGRIVELELMLKSAQVITHTKSNVVQVGSTVAVEMDGKHTSYTIVGSNEANPAEGRISNESPIGQAFLGKKVGDVASIKTPRGTVEARVEKIS